MLLSGTLLIIGLFSGFSTFAAIGRGWDDDFLVDRESDPKGFAASIRFNIWLTGALLVGALVSAILGV